MTPTEHELLIEAADLVFDCGAQFRLYEKLHRQKQTSEGLQKAQVNSVFAARCERLCNDVRALIRTQTSGGGGMHLENYNRMNRGK